MAGHVWQWIAACMVVLFLVEASGKIVDMTHQLDANNVFWPGNPPFVFTIRFREQRKSFWYEVNKFCTAEHGGTHLDSPSHFSKGKWRVHEIPIDHLIGPGVVIDISERARTDPDAEVQTEDILRWESEHGKIPEKSIIFMNSGWSSKWPNASKVLGTEKINDSSTLHFPGFSPDAAKWLVDNRKHINAVGVDTPSIDFGQSRDFVSHVVLSHANIVLLENVANLEKIPTSGAIAYAIPIKLFDGSGTPARIFAVLDDKTNTASLLTYDVILLMLSLSAYASAF